MYTCENHASDFTRKLNRADSVEANNSAWLQLSGHSGTFLSAGSKTVWKKRSGNEAIMYQSIQHDPLAQLVPKFYGEVEHNDDWFIILEDLLQRFHNPSVMDVKMGTRTFLENEVSNLSLRDDLYEKMVKIDCNEPSEEEHKQKAITKLRYMEFREKQSSSSNLGFRVEAIKLAGKKLENELQKVRCSEDIEKLFANFVCQDSQVCNKLVGKLQSMQEVLVHSNFFQHLETIGSSLLILYDNDDQVGVWMIDFAKTNFLENQTLTHVDPWVLGNKEDGYLFGLENLIRIFQRVAGNLKRANNNEIMNLKD